MPRTSLAALELLVAVEAQGSLSGAARALGLSQPTVTAGVRRLEQAMGVELVHRSSRGSALTAVGAVTAVAAREVIEASDRFEATAAGQRADRVDRLVVAASMTIAERLVPAWLAQWRQAQWPQGASDLPAIELLVRNSEDVMRGVVAGEAELGFIEGAHVRKGLHQRVIAQDELVVVVAPSHPWARRATAVTATEVAAAALVLREAGSGTREVLVRALATAGVTLPDGFPQLGSTAAIKSAVAQGDAVGVISVLAVDLELAQGTFVRVATSGLDLSRKLRMVRRSHGVLTPGAQRLATLAVGPAPQRSRAIAE